MKDEHFEVLDGLRGIAAIRCIRLSHARTYLCTGERSSTAIPTSTFAIALLCCSITLFHSEKATHGFEAKLVKGWQANVIWIQSTGSPFSITSDTAESNTGVAGGSERALLIGNPSALGNGGSCTYNGVTYTQKNIGGNNSYFNACAFSNQTFGTYVTSRRNFIHGPHARTVNLSLFKTFPLHDTVKLQLRAESFNLTNTPTFNNPDAGLGDSAFGQFTATRYGYNPREFQFALKLLF